MKKIELPCYGIKITLDDKMVGFGEIESRLSEADDSEYYGAINAIESLILAHAVAGINIESPAYIEGIETAVDAIGNNL